MQNNQPSINFVQNPQIPVFDRFLNWALTIGRLIIIITEVVAIAAFVYRFSLDEKLVVLHDQIKQKRLVIINSKSDEGKYRNLQERLSLAATFSEKGIKTNEAIEGIISPTSNQVNVNDITLNKDRENIHLDVTSVSALADFIQSLQSNQGIKSISVDNIESKPSVGLSIDITAMLK